MQERHFIQARILRGVILLLFGVLVVDMFILQIVQHDHYKGQSLQNRQVKLRVKAPRGRFLDREGQVLADNVYMADITLPRACLTVAGPDSTLAKLMRWFSLPETETLERLHDQKAAGRPRLTLLANADMPRIATVEERRRELPGARVEARARRRYKYDSRFAHIIGYVSEVRPEEVGDENDHQAYQPGDTVGREGLEAAWEDELRGEAGLFLKEVNAVGRVVGSRDIPLWPVVSGEDITLTLSLALQESLAVAMADRPGAAVALSLPSGEVLAAVSNPAYDPNLFTKGISSQEWRRLLDDPQHPFLNRLVQATYPPGSPYKIVTSLAGLEAMVVGKWTHFEPCYGSYRFGDRNFRCWKRSGHGDLDHAGGLVHSCDVFYYQLGLRLELEQLGSVARMLGLGKRTGSPFVAEVTGNIPDTSWYDDHYGPGRWTRGVLLNNAIGQGEILVTPLQMAVLTARVAVNDRDLVSRFRPGTDGDVERVARPLPFAIGHLDWLRHTMTQVVDMGTGTRARLEAIEVAGKTGTAQNPHGEDHAWFVCFAPASAPVVAFVVILEHCGHGGAVAAPVAARWLTAFFAWRDRPNQGGA
ncbi:penicillin-binding protein 2 [bacterium]|nr:penicillin-binding protein 2 [bacterium]MBU1072546.1 penicillin-binding protein 2 [bacterium]MBU1675005.1 penicillin-binding protein 2 [bacterium]